MRASLSRFLEWREGILDDDGEGEGFPEFVGSLVGSSGVDAAHFGEKPRSGGVDSFEMFFGSSGH